jgi:hypothetical protein
MSKPPILQSKQANVGSGSSSGAAEHGDRALQFEARTALGHKLWELRQEILATGEPLLDEDQIETEVDRRRGGVGHWAP